MYKYIKIIFIALVIALLFCACSNRIVEQPDPHEGMVQINDGSGLAWIRPVEGLGVNLLGAEEFTTTDGVVSYSGDFERGIDVSEHQQEIDWAAVAQSGMADFAFIRAGYRGYTEGEMFEDRYFRQNMDGAIENGVKVGLYFFSQAITPEEAVEEAEFLLELIAEYEIDLPIAYDWEPMHLEQARTEGLSGTILTDCAKAFCETIEEAGHESIVYLYRHIGYYSYELGRLLDYGLWVGSPGDAPDFYYEHSYWQYSFTGQVPGILGDVDLNLYFPSLPEPEASPEA